MVGVPSGPLELSSPYRPRERLSGFRGERLVVRRGNVTFMTLSVSILLEISACR
jgi:hypothetical protein